MVGECQLGTHRPTRARRRHEGRGLFPSDEQFWQWLAETVTTKLVNTPRPEDRLAAMWAAANQDDFDTARAAGNARTVRAFMPND